MSILEMFEMKRTVRRQLKSYYWSALLVCMIVFVVSDTIVGTVAGLPITLYGAVNYLFSDRLLILALASFALIFFVMGPMEVGRARYFLCSYNGDYRIRNMFFAFTGVHYFKIVLIMAAFLLIVILPIVSVYLFIVFVTDVSVSTISFFILMCFPGILSIHLLCRYRMLPYVLAENPKMSLREVWEENLSRTDSRKLEIFIIDLSFFALYILGLFAFGIGAFFVRPYHEATIVRFYHKIPELKRIEAENASY